MRKRLLMREFVRSARSGQARTTRAKPAGEGAAGGRPTDPGDQVNATIRKTTTTAAPTAQTQGLVLERRATSAR